MSILLRVFLPVFLYDSVSMYSKSVTRYATIYVIIEVTIIKETDTMETANYILTVGFVIIGSLGLISVVVKLYNSYKYR